MGVLAFKVCVRSTTVTCPYPIPRISELSTSCMALHPLFLLVIWRLGATGKWSQGFW